MSTILIVEDEERIASFIAKDEIPNDITGSTPASFERCRHQDRRELRIPRTSATAFSRG